MKRWIGSIGSTLLALALAGCGGGSSAPVQPASVPASTGTNGTQIDATIVVPGSGASSQSAKRSAQYVSPSTLGLMVTVTDIPPTGGTASFTPTITYYNLGTGANAIVIPTPASATGHSEDLTYVAYNLGTVANNTGIAGGAKAVAWGLTTGFVVVPGQNTTSVVLSGVVNSFPAPLAESGAFGMMSAAPPALAGAQTSLGFGGNATPSGVPTLLDAGGANIATADGGPWSVVGGVPATATAAATGVPVTIAETAGSCGAVGNGPHLKISYAGGAAATSAALTTTNGALTAQYDGNGGAGWSAVISAVGQSSTLTYTLASLAATSTNGDFVCGNQTLSFSQPNETALMTIVEQTKATPYTLTVPNTTSCTNLVNVYAGATTAAGSRIPYGTPTSLGALTTFTIQLIASPPAAAQCNIKIQDANATLGVTGGATYPGATTYVAALLPSNAVTIIVP